MRCLRAEDDRGIGLIARNTPFLQRGIHWSKTRIAILPQTVPSRFIPEGSGSLIQMRPSDLLSERNDLYPETDHGGLKDLSYLLKVQGGNLIL